MDAVLLAWLATAGPGPLSLDRVALRALGGTRSAATPAPAAPAHN